MKLTVFENPEQFMAVAQPVLEENEGVNSLMLGVGLRLLENPAFYDSQPYMCMAGDPGNPAVFALMTPPLSLQICVINEQDAAVFGFLAESLRAGNWNVRTVMAVEETGRAFAAAWGEPWDIEQRTRLHMLHEVRHPAYSAGQIRTAGSEDLELIAGWHLNFQQEADVSIKRDSGAIRTKVKNHIAAGQAFIWENNGPVSMALRIRPTKNSESIGGVYTPPEYRCSGYATSCVARLSQKILDSGKAYCCLFTDLANPTSNKIYRSIGYEPVSDFVTIGFRNMGSSDTV